MKLIAAWALFWVGHIISRGPMNWTERQWVHDILYGFYNWCMCASSDLDNGNRIWRDCSQDDE